jgi:RNA polymerase sigma factor for flagellar operon FliA
MSRTASEQTTTSSTTVSSGTITKRARGAVSPPTPSTIPSSADASISAATSALRAATSRRKASSAATAIADTALSTALSTATALKSGATKAAPPARVKNPRVKVPAQPRVVNASTGAEAAATRATKAPPKPVPLSKRPIESVWREYRVTPTTEIRNYLIAHHLDLVSYAAERLHKRLPSEVELNDLKSAGAFGLMDAVDSFDPDRGVKFETYCTQRVRGAMFDELRSMDWVPRLVRSRTAKVDKVRKSIEMETGNRATETEVASRLNVSGEEFDKLHKDSRPISMVSLTRKCFETDSSKDVREIDVVEDSRQENPLQAVQKQDLQALITKGLSRAERLIVVLYYYEEMTMKEIGATLDLSESRVSQMHSSILARLKAQMQHRETVEE